MIQERVKIFVDVTGLTDLISEDCSDLLRDTYDLDELHIIAIETALTCIQNSMDAGTYFIDWFPDSVTTKHNTMIFVAHLTHVTQIVITYFTAWQRPLVELLKGTYHKHLIYIDPCIDDHLKFHQLEINMLNRAPVIHDTRTLIAANQPF